MNKLLKYIIFFLLGVILYYFLMQTIQGQKVVEGFSIINTNGLFENYPLYIKSNATGVEKTDGSPFDVRLVGNDQDMSEFVSGVRVTGVVESIITPDKLGKFSNAIPLSLNLDYITSNINEAGYIYRPDYLFNPFSVTANQTFAEYNNEDQFTKKQNFNLIKILPPTTDDGSLTQDMVEGSIFYAIKNIRFDSTAGLIVDNVRPSCHQYLPEALGLEIKNWNLTDIQGVADGLPSFNNNDANNFIFDENCIIYANGGTDTPVSLENLLNLDFIIIKIETEETQPNSGIYRFKGLQNCEVFININFINDYFQISGENPITAKFLAKSNDALNTFQVTLTSDNTEVEPGMIVLWDNSNTIGRFKVESAGAKIGNTQVITLERYSSLDDDDPPQADDLLNTTINAWVPNQTITFHHARGAGFILGDERNILIGKPFNEPFSSSKTYTDNSFHNDPLVSSHIDNFRRSEISIEEFKTQFQDCVINDEPYINKIRYRFKTGLNTLIEISDSGGVGVCGDNDFIGEQILADGKPILTGDVEYFMDGAGGMAIDESTASTALNILSNVIRDGRARSDINNQKLALSLHVANMLTTNPYLLAPDNTAHGAYPAPVGDLVMTRGQSIYTSTSPDPANLNENLQGLKTYLDTFTYEISYPDTRYLLNYLVHYLNTIQSDETIDTSTLNTTGTDAIDSSILLVMKGLQTNRGGGFTHSKGCLAVQDQLPSICESKSNPIHGIRWIPKTVFGDTPKEQQCEPYPPGDLLYTGDTRYGNCVEDADICCVSSSCFTYLENNEHVCAEQNKINNPYGECDAAHEDTNQGYIETCSDLCCGVTIHNSIEKLFNDIYNFNKWNGVTLIDSSARLISPKNIRNYIYGELIDFGASNAFSYDADNTPQTTPEGYSGNVDPRNWRPSSPPASSASPSPTSASPPPASPPTSVQFDSDIIGCSQPPTSIQCILTGLANELLYKVDSEHVPDETPTERKIDQILADISLKNEDDDGILYGGDGADQVDNLESRFNTIYSGSGDRYSQQLSRDLNDRAGISTTIDGIKDNFANFIATGEGAGLAGQIMKSEEGYTPSILDEIKISIILLDSDIPEGIAGILYLNKTPLELSFPEEFYNKATFAMAL